MSSGGRKVKVPPPAAPVALTMEHVEDEARRKGEALRRRLLAAIGRGGTILTQPSTLGEPYTQKASLLGG